VNNDRALKTCQARYDAMEPPEYWDDYADYDEPEEDWTCPQCNGTGMYWDFPCDKCDGEGRLDL
jgi:hypothetical protein